MSNCRHTFHRRPSPCHGVSAQLLCVGLLCAGGCGALPDGAALPESTWLAANPTTMALDISEVATTAIESPFGNAVQIDLPVSLPVTVNGRISSPDIVVTYGIGALQPGERLEVDVAAITEGFDPAVAVFDESSNWIDLNDNSGSPGRGLDAGFDMIARRAVGECFVVVSASSRSDSTGEYLLTIRRKAASVIREPAAQVVYLDFGGRSGVVIGRRPPVDVPPFSGDLIASEFSYLTDELMELITQRVRLDFAGYDVAIVASHEQPPPAGQYTSIYFGSYDPALLGIADDVDVGNGLPVQDAIVFVDTFAVFMSQEPTAIEITDALANVASHEIGHLLGLQHTNDPRSIMDTTATLRQMMTPQAFRRAPLHTDTFPVGYQDAPLTLLLNTGGDAKSVCTARQRSLAKVHDPWYDAGPVEPVRAKLWFGTSCSEP